MEAACEKLQAPSRVLHVAFVGGVLYFLPRALMGETMFPGLSLYKDNVWPVRTVGHSASALEGK